jgi:hypothetical protein
MLNRFGFFGDKPKAEAVAEVTSLRSDQPQESEDRILKYLRSGKQIVAVAGLASDVLTGNIIGPPNVFTDGEWTWTSDAIHYVQQYHVRIPAEFKNHMESNNWQVPTVANPESLVASSWTT